MLFHERPDSDAFDRIRRAYHPSRSTATSKTGCLSAAWLYHLEFNRGNISESVLLSSEALQYSIDSLPESLSRTALTTADIFSHCGNRVESSEWSTRSRAQAVADGARLAVRAVLHNIVTLRVHALRLSKFCKISEPPRRCWAELELNSSRNHDTGIELLSLISLEPIIRAQLLVLHDRVGGVLPLLDESIISLQSNGLIRYQAVLLVDRLRCNAKLLRIHEISESAESIHEALE